MPQVDGDIKLTATLTPGDIRKTAQQLKSELRDLFNAQGSDKLSVQFQKTQASIAKTINKIDTLEKKLAEIENSSKVPTKEYEEITKFIEESQTRLTEINALLKEERELGISPEFSHNKQLIVEAEELKQTITFANSELETLVETGKAFTLGSDSDQYKRVANQLNEANNQLTIQKAQLEGIIEKEQQLPIPIEEHKEAIEKTTPAVRKFGRAHKESSFHIDDFGKKLKKGLMTILKYGLGIRGLFALFRKLRTAVKEGFENLQNFSDPLKESVSEMKASFSTIKNSIASAFAPIAERVIPLITSAANRLTELFNNLGRYIAILFNKPTYTKAVAVQSDYAKSLEKTEKAAKGAVGALAGFDELTIIDTGSGDNNAEDAVEDTAKMFELVETATGAGSPFGKFAGFFEDIWGKLLKVADMGKKFVEFLSRLNLEPLKTSLSNLWSVLSPIIDEILADADWFREHVLQPITQFLVEKGIPAAIDTIRIAIDNIWKAFKPFKDGIKAFWEQNGGWIMDLLSETYLNAIEFIQEAFGEIGKFFTKNNTKIKNIFSSLSNIVEKLSPFIKAISKLIGTHAGETFVQSIRDIFTSLEPILTLLEGIFKVIDGLINWDKDKMADGFGIVGESILQLLLAPLKMVLGAFATLLDTLAVLVEKVDKDAAQAMRDFADTIRGTDSAMEDLNNSWWEADEVSRVFHDNLEARGELVDFIGRINEANIGMNLSVDTIESLVGSIQRVGPKSKEEFEILQYWTAWCKKYGVTPLIQSINDIGPAGANAATYFSNAWATSLNGLIGAASGAGGDIGRNILNNAQAVLNMSKLQIQATVTAQINGVNVNDKWRLALAAAGVPISGFATGGYPTPGSLFWAGENGMPEMLGTIGGRTTVAGGAEITGIREAIEAQGESQNRLLSQLISTVDSKDLSLVANANAGRWINKSLKAYQGVTG